MNKNSNLGSAGAPANLSIKNFPTGVESFENHSLESGDLTKGYFSRRIRNISAGLHRNKFLDTQLVCLDTIDFSPSLSKDLMDSYEKYGENVNYWKLPPHIKLAFKIFFEKLDFYYSSTDIHAYPREYYITNCILEGPKFAEYLKKLREESYKHKVAIESYSDTFDKNYSGYEYFFNQNHLINWKIPEPDENIYFEHSNKDVEIVESVLEDYKSTLESIICSLSFDEITKEEVGFNLFSTLIFDDIKDETKIHAQSFFKEERVFDSFLKGKFSLVQKSPSEIREIIILTLGSRNSHTYYSRNLFELIKKLKENCLGEDPAVIYNRMKEFFVRFNYFFMKDYSKAGATIPKELIKATYDILEKYFPVFKDASQFYCNGQIYIKDQYHKFKRGHFIGMGNELQTLVSIVISRMIHVKNVSLFLNDDSLSCFKTKDQAMSYASYDELICYQLGLRFNPVKSIVTYKELQFCEMYVSDSLDMKKLNLYLSILNAMSCLTIGHAKEFVNGFSSLRDPLLDKALSVVISFWGYEFHKNEALSPYLLGGWLTPINFGMNETLLYIKGVKEEQACYYACSFHHVESSGSILRHSNKLFPDLLLFKKEKIPKNILSQVFGDESLLLSKLSLWRRNNRDIINHYKTERIERLRRYNYFMKEILFSQSFVQEIFLANQGKSFILPDEYYRYDIEQSIYPVFIRESTKQIYPTNNSLSAYLGYLTDIGAIDSTFFGGDSLSYFISENMKNVYGEVLFSYYDHDPSVYSIDSNIFNIVNYFMKMNKPCPHRIFGISYNLDYIKEYTDIRRLSFLNRSTFFLHKNMLSYRAFNFILECMSISDIDFFQAAEYYDFIHHYIPNKVHGGYDPLADEEKNNDSDSEIDVLFDLDLSINQDEEESTEYRCEGKVELIIDSWSYDQYNKIKEQIVRDYKANLPEIQVYEPKNHNFEKTRRIKEPPPLVYSPRSEPPVIKEVKDLEFGPVIQTITQPPLKVTVPAFAESIIPDLPPPPMDEEDIDLPPPPSEEKEKEIELTPFQKRLEQIRKEKEEKLEEEKPIPIPIKPLEKPSRRIIRTRGAQLHKPPVPPLDLSNRVLNKDKLNYEEAEELSKANLSHIPLLHIERKRDDIYFRQLLHRARKGFEINPQGDLTDRVKKEYERQYGVEKVQETREHVIVSQEEVDKVSADFLADILSDVPDDTSEVNLDETKDEPDG